MKQFLLAIILFSSTIAYSQLVSDSVLIGGHYRSFHYFHHEASMKGGSLLFIMHGSGGKGENMVSRTKKLEATAEKEKLLIVYPDAYLNYWNECRKYSTAVANKEDIDENSFFRSMISYFHEHYGIDKEKVFAAGFSGGGHMAYKLALTMPGTIKGIAAIVANMPDSASCDCKLSGKPMPVLIINGTEDGTNPYNGGEMFVNNASFGVVRSTENTFAYWASLAGYKGKPVKIQLPDTDTADHKTIESFSYSASGKAPVRLLKVIGGHHDYPGDIDVYEYVWAFFKTIK